MKNKLSRLLFVSLCSVFMCGSAPELAVSAAQEPMMVIEQREDGQYYYTEMETEATTEVSQQEYVADGRIDSLGSIEESENNISFTTFEDLKELAGRTYDNYTYVSYQGSGALVIEENLTLPAQMQLYVSSGALVIPEGVTLDMTDYSSYISVSTLDVQGTLVVNGSVSVSELLNVTGTMYLYQNMSMSSTATITGSDKIVYGNSWSKIYWNCDVYSMEEFKDAVTTATECTNEHYFYYLYPRVEISINESIEIPVNTQLNLYGQAKLTVEAGCQLTVNMYTSINTPVMVYGTLNNKATISVDAKYGGSLTFADGGAYTGSGAINVYADDEAGYKAALQGLDLSKFEITEENTYSHYWILRDTSGLIQLGTPTNLEWGYDHDVWDYETQSNVTVELPGSISWKTTEPDQGQATINIYREGETVPYKSHSWSFGSTYIPEWRSIDSFCNDNPESGTYYFTVQTTADYTAYRNSEIVTSDTWTYVKPDKQLDAPTNLRWTTWPNFTWDMPDSECVGGRCLEILYAPTKDATPTTILSTWSRSSTEGGSVWEDRMQGDGYYYFKVSALSSDITVECNSEWSELSEPYVVNGLIDGVESQLDEIASEATTPAEIRDAVQAMDTQDLKDAMNSDNSNSDIIDKLVELENAAGGAAPVDVSEEAAAFATGDITVVGANLNSPATEEEPITLVIDKPERDDVIPAAYNNSVAVKFSMTLDNVTDTENLEVPVQITLPVPATINPDFLVILHYHANGSTVEEIRPKVYVVGNQYYAKFVLTSFSDFAMTQFTDIFEDLVDGAYYEEAVQWAVSYGITNGYGNATTFCPELVCTRAQVVTFLWRANGCPEPASLNNPFTDVASDAYYYKAVLWAVEQGITNGYGSDTIFNPDGECTRGQVATFMWRAEGEPAVNSATNPFVDLVDGAYYGDAVLWAVENGITNGYGEANTFCPEVTCTRGQIVTFLYRGMN